MTQAPHLLLGARARVPPRERRIGRLHDARRAPRTQYDHVAMGLSTERFNAKVGIYRERQDALAAAEPSRRRPRRSRRVVWPRNRPRWKMYQRKGDPILVDTDEGVRPGRDSRITGRARARPRRDRTITAGDSSQISDGACAVVVMSAERAARTRGLAVGSGRRLRHGGRTGQLSLLTPAVAGHRQGCPKGAVEGRRQYDLFEINEAFATVGLASMDDLGIDEAKVNVNGGGRSRWATPWACRAPASP